MRLPRFRLRTLMVAVAIAAMACGAEQMRRRRVKALEMADFHSKQERDHLWVAKIREHAAEIWRERAEREHTRVSGAWNDRERRFLESCVLRSEDMAIESANGARTDHKAAALSASLRLKYARAARYPWLPVAPDAPPP